MGKMKLLFIHGAGGTKNKWRKVKELLGSDSVEMIDLPGHGENNTKLIPSIQDYASWIDNKISEDTIVIGHSMGGLVALEVAARNQNVKGVVFAASSYELPVDSKLLEKLSQGTFPDSLFYASYAKEANKDLLEEERIELELTPIEVTHADFKLTNQYKEGKNRLLSLEIPVCAIFGEKDRLLPQNVDEVFKSLKSDIKISTIKGAGHYVMVEKAEEFVSALKEFARFVETNVKI